MSVFDQLVGQARAVAVLRRAVTVPAAMTHAWLVTGPPGSGRSVAARAFAAALQCERTDDPGCGECHACRTVLAGSHPDVSLVSTTETFIRVDRARELALTAATRPSTGRWRVLVVEDADRLNEQAADALLKSLEEPPPRTVWVLCAPTADDLIVTVRSRCRHLQLGTPPVDAVADLLVGRDGIDPAMAHYAARAAQSHVGIARRLATDEHARARRREIVAIPASLTGVGAALRAAQDLVAEAGEGAETISTQRAEAERRALLTQLGADPSARSQPPAVRSHLRDLEVRQKRETRRQQHDSIDSALTDLASVYRDALMLATGAPVEPVNATEPEQIQRLARSLSPEGLLAALEAITLARGRLVANGAPLLVLEAMMVALVLPDRAGTRA
ncbi:DNA polymerase III subunit delta' [Ornithinimicrobium sp. W1679]|uniref:DNA polymerase III subunit delta' n=1 Tax=Ornithinimicrobium sp. W1679 TaxID=3418770 RepID=UPI003CEF5AFC